MYRKVLSILLAFGTGICCLGATAYNAGAEPDIVVQEGSSQSLDVGSYLENGNPEEIIDLLDLHETAPGALSNRFESDDGSISMDFAEGSQGDYAITFTVENNPGVNFYGIRSGMTNEEANDILKALGWPPPRNSGSSVVGYYNFNSGADGFHIWIENGAITNWSWTNWVEGEISENPFEDVPCGIWFYDSVIFVYNHWIMTGLDSHTFGPTEILSRAQFATILYRMEGEPDVSGLAAAEFPDVPDGIWYDDAVTWANAAGIITGYTDGTAAGNFGAVDLLTRAQMVTMLYRYAQYKEYNTDVTGDLSVFPDAGEVPDFAADGMPWAVEHGIIRGDESGEEKMLKPQDPVSRAVGATVIERFFQQ